MLHLEAHAMRREINNTIRTAYERVKSTELSYPNRASLLGLLGAALTLNKKAGAGVLRRQLDAEFKAHMSDALKPLGLALGPVSVRTGSSRHTSRATRNGLSGGIHLDSR